MKLSIVVPSYNRLYSLQKILFPSLARQDNQDFELILVDDASKDGTGAYLQSRDFATQFPELKSRLVYLYNEENKGAPASRNKGAALAKADWIYIIEDDVEIADPTFLGRAEVILEKMAKEVAVVSPQRREEQERGYYQNPPGNLVRIGRFSGEVYLDPRQEYSGWVENTHASSFIRTAIYNQFQQDEKLFFGNTFRDESDLYFRLHKAGYRIFYCGDLLKTLHRNNFASSGGQKKINNKSLLTQILVVWKNHYLYLQKNYNLAPLRLLFFIFVSVIKIGSNLLRLPRLKNSLALARI